MRSSCSCTMRSNMHLFFSFSSLILLVCLFPNEIFADSTHDGKLCNHGCGGGATVSHETSYSTSAAASGGCQRRCGGATPVPYPSDFSAGCPITLSCDANTSTPILPYRGGSNDTSYRVIAFNSTISAVLIAFPASCSRSVLDARRSLSSANYGVSSRTELFLRGGCSETNASECSVPSGLMSNLLRTAQYGENGTASGATGTVACVSSAAPDATTADHFLRWDKAEKYQCEGVLTSSVYMGMTEGTTSLEFSVLELVWWLNGTCAGGNGACAANATCSDVTTPSGALGGTGVRVSRAWTATASPPGTDATSKSKVSSGEPVLTKFCAARDRVQLARDLAVYIETNSPVCSVPATLMSRMLRTAQCRENNDSAVACVASALGEGVEYKMRRRADLCVVC